MALLAAPVIFFSLTVHEFFHAYLAYRFGDTTAKDMGRLTLNPLAHLDLFGTLMIFLSNFHFGWAKPVPINPFNLRNPRVADFWISAAGPLSNMGLGFIFGILYRLTSSGMIVDSSALNMVMFYGVQINVALAFFNLIPVFPLDGSHILASILPERYEAQLDSIQRFGPFILIILIVLGVVWMVLGPFVMFFVRLFAGLP